MWVVTMPDSAIYLASGPCMHFKESSPSNSWELDWHWLFTKQQCIIVRHFDLKGLCQLQNSLATHAFIFVCMSDLRMYIYMCIYAYLYSTCMRTYIHMYVYGTNLMCCMSLWCLSAIFFSIAVLSSLWRSGNTRRWARMWRGSWNWQWRHSV